MAFFDDLMLTRHVVEEGPERIVLEWNRARPAFLGGAFLVLGVPCLVVGVVVLVRQGVGAVPAWMVVALGLPPALLACALLPRARRHDRIEIDRIAAEVRVEGPRPLRLAFPEVSGVRSRRYGGNVRLLLELHGRAPLELLQGPPLVVQRLERTLVSWCVLTGESP